MWCITADKNMACVPYGTAIRRWKKWLHVALTAVNPGSTYYRTTSAAINDPKVIWANWQQQQRHVVAAWKWYTLNMSVRLMWAENLKYVLQLQKWKSELKNDMLMSANVALWGGRRHLLSLICSTLCGCYYKTTLAGKIWQTEYHLMKK